MQKGFGLIAIVFILAAIILAGGWYVLVGQKLDTGTLDNGGNTACPQDAKLCPDGSSVARTGPNCEFAECAKPSIAQVDTSDWKTYRNDEYGFEFRYPKSFKISNEGGDFGNLIGYVFSLSIGSTKSINELPPGIFAISIDVLDNPQGKSPQDWYSEYYQEQKKLAEEESGPFHLVAPSYWTPAILNGLSVFQLKQIGYPIAKPYDEPAVTIFTYASKTYFLGQNNDVREHNVSKDSEETFHNINRKILESFRFIQ